MSPWTFLGPQSQVVLRALKRYGMIQRDALIGQGPGAGPPAVEPVAMQ